MHMWIYIFWMQFLTYYVDDVIIIISMIYCIKSGLQLRIIFIYINYFLS